MGMNDEWEMAVRMMPLDYGYRMRRPSFEVHDFESKWGEWDAARRRIRLSWRLVSEHPWMDVREVFLHEMAHQVTDELLGGDATPHGEAFRRACGVLNADPRASHDYVAARDALARGVEQEEDRITSRVRKLLALGRSPNRHEAESAMAKAHELIARHSLDIHASGGAQVYFSMSLGEPAVRHMPADYAMSQLLRDFYMVETLWISAWVLARARMGKVLEVSGTRENVLMASYVHDFLGRTIEEQWEVEGSAHSHSLRRRNDFALGFIAGIRETLAAKDVELGRESERMRALVKHGDAALTGYFRRRHPYIRSMGRRGAYVDPDAHQAGRELGLKTVVSRPVERGGESAGRFLPPGRG
jgi:hypothetical protein